MMRRVHVTDDQIGQTLRHLQQAGSHGTECLVLWLGRSDADGVSVQAVYRPDQMALADVFRIPPASMRALLEALSERELMIAAQVHSHPYEAFHSKADDAWAIVRHVDALSLVLPDFALKSSKASFLDDAKIFRLIAANRWVSIENAEIGQWVKIR
jgi:proteasome lid subunit RPN8/RPN11